MSKQSRRPTRRDRVKRSDKPRPIVGDLQPGEELFGDMVEHVGRPSESVWAAEVIAASPPVCEVCGGVRDYRLEAGEYWSGSDDEGVMANGETMSIGCDAWRFWSDEERQDDDWDAPHPVLDVSRFSVRPLYRVFQARAAGDDPWPTWIESEEDDGTKFLSSNMPPLRA